MAIQYITNLIEADLMRKTKRGHQGGEGLGGETSGPLFMQCVMRSRTGTSAPFALPVRFLAGKIFLSTNRKSHFLSLIISQEYVKIKQLFNSLIFQVNVFGRSFSSEVA